MGADPSLPIAPLLPELAATLGRSGIAVLEAPPGAGKSTGAPLALLEAPWLAGKQLLMLEPRRLAARAIATRMADLLGEPVGATVGYRTRLDTRVSRSTRLTVLTEGVLTRMLQADPALEGVGLVIFDEFHERSLNADLGLALCLDARHNLRPELGLLVMSATLETAPVAQLLGGAPVLASAGRAYPVETVHFARPAPRDLTRATARAIRCALHDAPGDVLVFLPGAPEIRRLARLLQEASPGDDVDVHALFGDLPRDQQDAALAPAPRGRRKIVLATAIAETSLTITGVHSVVDAGLSRVSRFDPVTGMSRLVTQRVSQAAAAQRRGRAGRLGPGRCYRLWPEGETATLESATPPEILNADLAPLALELAAWGIADPGDLHFLDAPPAAHFAQARDLLRLLDAIDRDGRITRHGRAMAGLAMHPRLAHMLLSAGDPLRAALACELAAVLSERDLLRGHGAARDADIRVRIDVLRGNGPAPADSVIDHAAVGRARQQCARWRQAVGAAPRDAAPGAAAGELLALAYPDRIGMRRGDGRYLLSGGRGAVFADAQTLSQKEFIVAPELDAGERDARIYMAAPLERAALEAPPAILVEERDVVRWDSDTQAVMARRERRLGAILLGESRLERPDPSHLLEAMLEGVRRLGLAALPWSRGALALRERATFVGRHLGGDDWPDLGDEILERELAGWLGPWLADCTRREHLARLDLRAALAARFSHRQLQALDTLAPTHLEVPSGSRVAIDYRDPDAPAVAVRLQEVFGLTETPRIAGGRVPITLQLLSPARRPVQVTRDLGSFWARGYLEVRKELKGRYPKHYWPEDPHSATPTRRVRPKK